MNRRALLALSFLLSSGCSAINAYEDPPIVGGWKELQGASNTMEIELEGDGKASMFYTVQAQPGVNQRDDFSVTWEYDDDDTFKLEMDCKTSTFSCDDNNPTLMCNINSNEDKLDCSTSHPLWVNYPSLDWRAD